MKYFFILFFFFLVGENLAQPGCTDPQALNYDENATTNDGSCNYELTEYTLSEVALLPDELMESSGVEVIASGLWTHNDGGGEDRVYRIDSMTGEILQSVVIATADNIDWEDIAEDENHLYVGDFGNNPGNRTNLRIYKINKSDLSANFVNAELIEFSYSDQVDFSENINNNDFDCEAFVFYNDSLHLFTKNWVDNQTKHYVLPATIGTHIAEYVESFNIAGLITGADISENGEIVLIGYTEIGVNFMWLLFDFQDSFFFSGNKRKISLGTGLTNSQTEGITFHGNGFGYVCSEEFKVNDQLIFPQKLLSFSINQWIDNTTSVSQLDDSYMVLAYPNPFDNYIEIELSKSIDKWRLYNVKGEFLKYGWIENDDLQFRIKTSNLSSGSYFLELIKERQSKVIQLMKE